METFVYSKTTKILTILLFILSCAMTQAQSHKLALSFTGGYIQDGYGGMLTMDCKVNDFDFIQLNLQANFTEIQSDGTDIPVDLYAFNAGFFFDLIRNNNRKFNLSLGGGGTVGYEVINNGDDTLDNGQMLLIDSKVVYGAYVGLDADIFIVPSTAITINANETYHINSDVGEFSPYIGIGIKVILL